MNENLKNDFDGVSEENIESSIVKLDLDQNEERIQRLGCTGKVENCPVHNTDDQRYYYYVENQGIQKVC